MHPLTRRLFVASLLGWQFATPVGAEEFDARRRQAEANLATEAGRDFDQWLGEYFKARPEVSKELADCLARNEKRPALKGYIEFDREGGYRYVLRPEGPFADCVTRAFAGFEPPPPPILPYLNPFELNVASPGE